MCETLLRTGQCITASLKKVIIMLFISRLQNDRSLHSEDFIQDLDGYPMEKFQENRDSKNGACLDVVIETYRNIWMHVLPQNADLLNFWKDYDTPVFPLWPLLPLAPSIMFWLCLSLK